MLTHTLDVALTRFRFLRSKIDEVVTYDMLKKLKSHWVGYRGERNPYTKRAGLAGIDSGYNYVEYRGYAIYVLNSVAVLLSEEGEDIIDGVIDIDIAATSNIDYELSLLSLCAEVQLMEKAMRRADVVLVDGSLVAVYSKLYRASMDNGLEILDSKGVNVSEALKKLIYMVTLNPRKFVFISKNSSAKDLLGFVKGDVYYLERYTDFASGYTKPIDLQYSKHLGVATVARSFKRYARNLTGLDTTIYLTYARFSDFARVYRVEFVSESGEDSEDRIRFLFKTLSDVLISGYPYPLARAHSLARVGDRDIERIAVLLGVSKDPRGREELLL